MGPYVVHLLGFQLDGCTGVVTNNYKLDKCFQINILFPAYNKALPFVPCVSSDVIDLTPCTDLQQQFPAAPFSSSFLLLPATPCTTPTSVTDPRLLPAQSARPLSFFPPCPLLFLLLPCLRSVLHLRHRPLLLLPFPAVIPLPGHRLLQRPSIRGSGHLPAPSAQPPFFLCQPLHLQPQLATRTYYLFSGHATPSCSSGHPTGLPPSVTSFPSSSSGCCYHPVASCPIASSQRPLLLHAAAGHASPCHRPVPMNSAAAIPHSIVSPLPCSAVILLFLLLPCLNRSQRPACTSVLPSFSCFPPEASGITSSSQHLH
ncbi:hypothetical protein MRB53_002393 [Persea americana]|uniref:Uncharacterized protein n=1 Tax=Persea americana TaxID=3435 RepID=A0ACC2MVB5_PERAE|nr:hypothetical protein MRB53_002393 [Persea americana]